MQMINKYKWSQINFDVKLILCTASGTSFVYIVFVYWKTEALYHNAIPPLILVPEWPYWLLNSIELTFYVED